MAVSASAQPADPASAMPRAGVPVSKAVGGRVGVGRRAAIPRMTIHRVRPFTNCTTARNTTAAQSLRP